MPHPLRIFLLALSLAAGLLSVRPEPAYACIWNWQHVGNPFPPCEQKDMNEIARVRQANIKLGEKLLIIAGHIRTVEVEVRAWQETFATARSYEWRLKQLYGEVTAHPLPSMLAAYRRTSMASWVELDADGWKLSATPVDLRASADSIWEDFAADTAQYRMMIVGEQARWQHRIGRFGTMAENRLNSLKEYETYTRPALDSMAEAGNRMATRYEGRGDPDGLSESKISLMSARLNRLRGTAFETQALGLRARMEALDGAVDKNQELRRDDAVRQSVRY